MQEEVENRTVNLAISTTKLTGRTMGTIRSLRTMMQIVPLTKMIMNLCKQDRLDAWGNLRIAFT